MGSVGRMNATAVTLRSWRSCLLQPGHQGVLLVTWQARQQRCSRPCTCTAIAAAAARVMCKLGHHWAQRGRVPLYSMLNRLVRRLVGFAAAEGPSTEWSSLTCISLWFCALRLTSISTCLPRRSTAQHSVTCCGKYQLRDGTQGTKPWSGTLGPAAVVEREANFRTVDWQQGCVRSSIQGKYRPHWTIAPHNQTGDQLHGCEPMGADDAQSQPNFIYRASSCIEPPHRL